MKKLLSALFIITALAVCSCKKDDQVKEAEGTLIYSGSLALDGCEWLIKLGETTYHPNNLSDDDKKNNARVKISYTVTEDKYFCGQLPATAGNPGITVIKLNKIEFVN